MARDASNVNMTAILLRGTMSSWYARIALLALLAALIGAAFWYGESLSATYFSVKDSIVSRLGLGVVLVAVWFGILGWALVARRPWFLHYQLWAGSLFLMAFLLGVLSFFEPFEGALAAFTLEGEVSLGGTIGYAITGDVIWFAAFKLLTIFIVGAFVASPRLSMDISTILGKLMVATYIFGMVSTGWIGRRLGRMYKVDKSTEVETDAGSDELPAGSWSENLRRTMQSDEYRERVSATGLGARDSGIGARSELRGVREDAALTTDLATDTRNLDPSWTQDKPDTQDLTPSIQSPNPSSPGLVRWNNPKSETDDEDGSGRKVNKLWDGKNEGPPTGPEAEPPDGDKDEKPSRVMSMVHAVLDGMPASSWARPSLNMFVDANEGGITQEEMAETAHTIKETLGHYGVEVEVEETKPGPTVTMYGLVPGWIRKDKQVNVTDSDGKSKLDDNGKQIKTRVETKTRVRVDTITAREKDLSLALKTPSIRIETPVMGKSLVGIEVPNPNPALVTLRNVMQDGEFQRLRQKAKLPVAIGKGGSGETVIIDLAKMPHLLVAGSTGSGKSVFINTIISALIIEKDPSELRLLLIDPKRVELTPYNGIPHLLTPVVVDTDQVVSLLRGLIREMMDRYRRMEELGVRNIDSYNTKSPDRMPYLVIAVDELADLMMTASVDVEQALCRLAQLGRATGIHLVVATQRPSVDVLTGLIKANFPSRVSFAVTSQIDSRTILDTSGAEKLLGKGDMLYQSVDMSRPERVQGVFISDPEIENLVEFWQTTPRGPMAEVDLEPVGGLDSDAGDDDDDASHDRDDMMDKAIELAMRQKKVSTSLLQRRLRIGYPRAARLMDQMEDEGIVGPSDGSKSRDVIIGSL
jgi:Cdc6-like AAA superfamily ATPase